MLIRVNTQNLPLADESIDMVFSDPPYIKEQIITYQWLANEAARVLKPGKFAAVMCGGMALNDIMRWFDDAGLSFYWLYQLGMTATGAGIVWKHGNNNVPISTRTKHVLVYSKGRALARTATVGLYWAGGVDKKWHHWGQDIDSHRYYIDCFSSPGDVVLDPMVGGGTTAVACKLLGRKWIVGDIDADAVTTTRKRLGGVRDTIYPELPLFTAPNPISSGLGGHGRQSKRAQLAPPSR